LQLFKKILPILFAGALVGCATQWNHPTASQYDFQRDQAQCNQYAAQANPTVQTPNNPYLTPMQQSQQSMNQGGANLGAAFGQMASFNNCMKAKGYYKAN
jgi:hypothetical protein